MRGFLVVVKLRSPKGSGIDYHGIACYVHPDGTMQYADGFTPGLLDLNIENIRKLDCVGVQSISQLYSNTSPACPIGLEEPDPEKMRSDKSGTRCMIYACWNVIGRCVPTTATMELVKQGLPTQNLDGYTIAEINLGLSYSKQNGSFFRGENRIQHENINAEQIHQTLIDICARTRRPPPPPPPPYLLTAYKGINSLGSNRAAKLRKRIHAFAELLNLDYKVVRKFIVVRRFEVWYRSITQSR